MSLKRKFSTVQQAPAHLDIPAPLHLEQEFGDVLSELEERQSTGDFYDIHGLVAISPRTRKSFYIKKDSNSGPPPPQVQQAADDDDEPPASRLYTQRFPQSLYGPLGELIPRLTPQHLNLPIPASSAHTLSNSAPNSARRESNVHNDSLSTVGTDGLYEERTLSQLAAASCTAAVTRDFGAEWDEALAVNHNVSLSVMSCRFARLKTIAEEFAATVSPIACAIVETRNQAVLQRPYRPIPTMDNVYIVKGHIYVISETPARVQLFGSHRAASKAASNEIRGVRTILGNPFLGVRTPLSCCVSFMGFSVFVSAPLPLSRNPHGNLMYGGFTPQRIAVSNGAIYSSFKMGEYIPLLRHSVPDAALPASTANAPEVLRSVTTAYDVKQMCNSINGTAYVMDSARYLPTAVCHTSEYSKIKTKEDGMGAKGLSRHPLEDEPLSFLSVLFRPEFMRLSCPLQLNPDANTLFQPLSAQENTSHAIHTLFTQNCWQLLLELLTAEQSKTLKVADISSIFHKHGVNMRYLGKVYSDLDASMKHSEIRENVKRKIALEAACRTLKAIVFQRISAEHRYRGEEGLIVALFRQFLLCTDLVHATQFWEQDMRRVMTLKFGFFVKVAREAPQSAQDRDDSAHMFDGNSLNVYRCITNVKRRIEKVTPQLNWTEVGGGFVALDEAGIDKLRRQSEDALSVLYPLIGANAKENSELLIRAQQVMGIELSSDLRGKKILVTFRPKVKPCTPLVLSPALQAVCEGPTDIKVVMGQPNESAQFCEAVEAACRQEISVISKITESDPRATLPLQVLAMSYAGRYMLPQAFAACNRFFDLRKNVPIDAVVGQTSMEIAEFYYRCMTYDRAETLCVDSLSSLRNSTSGVDISVFIDCLISTAVFVAPILIEASGKPHFERAQRVLEYLYYAAFLAERYRLPSVATALHAIAALRRRIASAVSCFRCNKPAELFARAEFDTTQVEKVASEKDAMSVGSKPMTATTFQAASVTQSKSRPVPTYRRKKEEQRKEDDDITEVFAKKNIDRIATLYLENILGGGGPNRSNTQTAVVSTASSANIASLLAQSTNDAEVPIANVLNEFAKPSVVCKFNRYCCKGCSSKHPAPDKEPVMKDCAALYTKVSKLALGNVAYAALDRSIAGDSLLNVGVLELNAAAVTRAIEELSRTFGASSRIAISAAIQLADVLLEVSKVSVASSQITAPGGGAVVVVNPSAAATPSMGTGSNQAVNEVAEAEVVLQDALEKILERPDVQTSFSTELNTVVLKLQNIAQIYSQHPVAKKEHSAAHYLADVLPPVLGESHPLVGAVYNSVKHYYVQLAKRRTDRLAASTALQTAGKFACLALQSRVHAVDIEDEIDSLLTVMADDIVKVLRAGNAADRKASEELFSQAKQIIAASAYRSTPIVLQRLHTMEEIFKAQLKVMEHSEALSKLTQRIDDAKTRMLQLSKSIKKHHNRVDLYGKQCLQGITDIRDEIKRAVKNISEYDIQRHYLSLCELHDVLTKTSPQEEEDTDGQTNGENKDFGGVRLPGMPPGLAEANKRRANELAEAGLASQESSSPNPKLSRTYTSPYAILPGAPAVLEEDHGENNGAGVANRRTQSTGRVKARHSVRDSLRSREALSSAAQYYLSSLVDHRVTSPEPPQALNTPQKPTAQQQLSGASSPFKSPGSDSQGLGPNVATPAQSLKLARSGKRPETVDALAKLMPRIALSMDSRNYNPIKSFQYAQRK